MVPPDPMPNSEVKRRCADGSVGLPHVRVGHRQVLNVEPRAEELGVLFFRFLNLLLISTLLPLLSFYMGRIFVQITSKHSKFSKKYTPFT